jgi:hypothetical protein
VLALISYFTTRIGRPLPIDLRAVSHGSKIKNEKSADVGEISDAILDGVEESLEFGVDSDARLRNSAMCDFRRSARSLRR